MDQQVRSKTVQVVYYDLTLGTEQNDTRRYQLLRFHYAS